MTKADRFCFSTVQRRGSHAAHGARRQALAAMFLLVSLFLLRPHELQAQADSNVMIVSQQFMATARPKGAAEGDILSNGNLSLNLGSLGYLNTQKGRWGFSEQGLGPGLSILPWVRLSTVVEISGAETDYNFIGPVGKSEDLLQGDLSILRRAGPAGGFVRTHEDGTIEAFATQSGTAWLLSSVTTPTGYRSNIEYVAGYPVPSRITGPDGQVLVQYESSQSLFPGQQLPLITKITFDDGRFLTLEYSRDSYLQKVTGMDGTTLLEITRDSIGWKLPKQVITPAGTTEFFYMGNSQHDVVVSGIIAPDGNRTRFSRSAGGASVLDGGRTDYSYNGKNIAAVTQDGVQKYRAGFLADGRVQWEIGPDGARTDYTYAKNVPFPVAVVSGRVTRQYSYRPDGRTTSVRETFPQGNRQVNFTYDSLGRPTQAVTLRNVNAKGKGAEVSRTSFSYEGSRWAPTSSTSTSSASAKINSRGMPTETTAPDGFTSSLAVNSGFRNGAQAILLSNVTMGIASEVSIGRSGGSPSITSSSPYGSVTVSGNGDTDSSILITSIDQQTGVSSSTLSMNSRVTRTETGVTTSETCASPVDGCVTTSECTFDPQNPDACTFKQSQDCDRKEWPPRPAPPSCTANCSGKSCGADGCGGSCGSCPSGQTCNSSGRCIPQNTCQPSCIARTCGSDGCGGSCGNCRAGSTCRSGNCVPDCVRNCSGRSCGSDGCGGSCGSCPAGQQCSATGQCSGGSACQPSCSGKQCGEDGCGGSCGNCALGNVYCVAGQCLSPTDYCSAYPLHQVCVDADLDDIGGE